MCDRRSAYEFFETIALGMRALGKAGCLRLVFFFCVLFAKWRVISPFGPEGLYRDICSWYNRQNPGGLDRYRKHNFEGDRLLS